MHSVDKCVHGTVVSQCRCPGPKAVKIVACPSWCLLGGTPVSMCSEEPTVFGPASWDHAHGDECPCTDCQKAETD